MLSRLGVVPSMVGLVPSMVGVLHSTSDWGTRDAGAGKKSRHLWLTPGATVGHEAGEAAYLGTSLRQCTAPPVEDHCTPLLHRAKTRSGPNSDIHHYNRTLHVNDIVSSS